MDTERFIWSLNVKKKVQKIFGVGNNNLELEQSPAAVFKSSGGSQKLNLLFLPEPEACTNHALTATSVALTPYISLGEKKQEISTRQ